MPRLGAVFVHFHTPALLVEAVSALVSDWRSSGIEVGKDGEVVIVDHGNDDMGRARLADLPATYLDPKSNPGFAAGVNLGAAELFARGVEAVLLVNPDVFVHAGCSAALWAELVRGAGAAGPLFSWDREGRILLPPTERRTRTDELLSALASRGSGWAERARRRWRCHARRHWLASGPLATAALSGGLLAISRSAWETIGPFDAEYRLYFEETDWLLRLVRHGGVSRLVPAARAVHLHGRSAVAEPAAAQWFEESAARFRVRFYGERFASVLARAARKENDAHSPHSATTSRERFPAEGLDLARLAHRSDGEWPLWVELSPRSVGFPAAAEYFERAPAAPWPLPREIAERMAGETLWVTVSDARGRELGGWEIS